MIVIRVGCLLIDDDEFLLTTFRLLDLVCPEFYEEVHNMGHSLGVLEQNSYRNERNEINQYFRPR
jgi:hypothetical protein